MPLDPNSYYDIPGMPLFQQQPYTPDQIRFLRERMPSFLESPSQGDVANLLDRWGYPLQSPSFGDFSTLAGQQRQAGTGGFAGKGGGFFQTMLGNILANLATGGLYGTAKGLTSGDPWEIAAAGAVPMSPGGVAQINTEVRGPQSTAIGAAGTLAGAGLAGAFSSEPLTQGQYLAGLGESGGQYATTLTPAQLAMPVDATGAIIGGATGAGAGGAGEGSVAAPLAGALLANQIYGMMNQPGQGQVGQPIPEGGAQPATQGRPAQTGNTIGGSEPHKGLAPRFEQRQKGQPEAPGLAARQFDYLRSYYGGM